MDYDGQFYIKKFPDVESGGGCKKSKVCGDLFLIWWMIFTDLKAET